jgi:hypothetical protein
MTEFAGEVTVRCSAPRPIASEVSPEPLPCWIGARSCGNPTVCRHGQQFLLFTGEDGLGDEVVLEHSMFLQAALEGIGFYFSTGDNVPLGTPHPEPDYPSSDPLVTAVGGTTMEVDSYNGYLFETAWGDHVDGIDTSTNPPSWMSPLPGAFAVGGGGGVSSLFSQSLYQRGVVPRSLTTLNGSTPMRAVPNVAAVADTQTGFPIVFLGSPGLIGGTSLSAPLFAAVQACRQPHRRLPIGFADRCSICSAARAWHSTT